MTYQSSDANESATGRRLTREEALERLAYELNWKQEQLDPSEDGDWERYSESDKAFFRECIEWLLSHPDLVSAALSEASPTTTS
jgi:hypothetical protein